ncbi:Peptide/nickel transport system permease protein [Paraburkholderia tropica]|uniref:ABC transporter permease n=1 Tax=Paraburkholderia tropica TaxID=92647 RepID=UPI001CB49663|nr:ABC transporter permease [Paraburkholderia tropica]CAG9221933.1 Peptide/nickel transport system permease protein [Paraburkholderia tropica]
METPMQTQIGTPITNHAATQSAAARFAWRFITRLIRRAAILAAVSVVIFATLRLLHADPAAMLLPANATLEQVAAMRHQLGLDQPIAVQYLHWLGGMLHGDFGRSMQNGQPVAALIGAALPTTLQLLALGLLLGVSAGVGSALYAFSRRGTFAERLCELVNGVAMAVPDFLWGILFVLLFGIALRWLPFLGPIDNVYIVARHTGFLLIDTLIDGQFAAFGNALLHLVLPCVALALGIAPPLMRILRSSLLDTWAEEYVHAARLRGLSEAQILRRHGWRNAALPTLNLLAMQASLLIGGTLLIEKVFGLPGIGALMINAIGSRDLPVIEALALIYAVVVQCANAAADALEVLLNPRLRIQ